MRTPRPREAVERAHRTTTLILWSAGVGLLFLPAAATLLLFATDPLVGPIGSNSPRGDVNRALLAAIVVVAMALYLGAALQAYRFGRAHGHRDRHADFNPLIVFVVWTAHYLASWAAIGFLFGRIDRHAAIRPIHVDQGIGLYLLVFGMLLAFWALGRFGARH